MRLLYLKVNACQMQIQSSLTHQPIHLDLEAIQSVNNGLEVFILEGGVIILCQHMTKKLIETVSL